MFIAHNFTCPGNDETLIGALALGLDSAVGSTYNFMPQVEKTLFNNLGIY